MTPQLQRKNEVMKILCWFGKHRWIYGYFSHCDDQAQHHIMFCRNCHVMHWREQ